nr:TPA_asm: m100.5 sORF 3 [Murid betaherpesvirus 1]DBA07873.1 TPA_asm: m100.5 sORF 3 [Murid betaherpesvirus 1]
MFTNDSRQHAMAIVHVRRFMRSTWESVMTPAFAIVQVSRVRGRRGGSNSESILRETVRASPRRRGNVAASGAERHSTQGASSRLPPVL